MMEGKAIDERLLTIAHILTFRCRISCAIGLKQSLQEPCVLAVCTLSDCPVAFRGRRHSRMSRCSNLTRR